MDGSPQKASLATLSINKLRADESSGLIAALATVPEGIMYRHHRRFTLTDNSLRTDREQARASDLLEK